MNKLEIYLYNWLVLLSKSLNTLRGGTPHESISMWLGRKVYLEETNNKAIIAFKELVNAFFLLLGEEDHVYDAVDVEDRAQDLWDGYR